MHDAIARLRDHLNQAKIMIGIIENSLDEYEAAEAIALRAKDKDTPEIARATGMNPVTVRRVAPPKKRLRHYSHTANEITRRMK